MSKKIKIKSAPGNPPSSTDGAQYLVGCWFEQSTTPGQFILYGPIATGLQNNQNFSFDLQNLSWSITNFQIAETSSNANASGSWSATPITSPETMPSEEGGDPETGTFQANDTVDPIGESSASAYA